MVVLKIVTVSLALAIAWGLAAPAWAVCDSGQPTQTPIGRYVIRGETVYDKKSDLTWRRCSAGQSWQEGTGCAGVTKYVPWKDAMQEASGGWRIPTLDELKTLISPTCKNPAINEEAFPGIELDKVTYWTTTEAGSSPAYAWYVFFGDGSSYYNYRTGMGAVRLVRSGQ